MSIRQNTRELEQVLDAAVALTDTGEIRLEHLPEAIRTYTRPSLTTRPPEERVLRERLLELLRKHDGKLSAVGRAMDRGRIQVRRWCQRLQIEPSQFRRSSSKRPA